MNKLQYYTTVTRESYIGKRYFKVDWKNDEVVQVVLNGGDYKKGKGNQVGIYVVSRVTFIGNYLGRFVEPCTKAEYIKGFKKVVEYLV